LGFSDHSKIKEIVNDVLYRITYVTAKFRELPFNKKSKYLIPVKNGVIVLRDINELLPNSPVFGFTYCRNVNYDPKADTKPVKEFLESLVDTDEEYELLGLMKELQRQEYLRRHLQKVLPVVAEMESLKEKVKLNGHFRNLGGFEFNFEDPNT